VATIETGSPTVGAALKQAALVSFGAAEIALRIPPGLHARTLEAKRAEVEAAFARELGAPVRVTLTVGELPPGAPAAPPVAQVERAEREARSRERVQAARAHPNIQQAAEILGGEIDRTDEI
jgi:hypothetical protein